MGIKPNGGLTILWLINTPAWIWFQGSGTIQTQTRLTRIHLCLVCCFMLIFKHIHIITNQELSRGSWCLRVLFMYRRLKRLRERSIITKRNSLTDHLDVCRLFTAHSYADIYVVLSKAQNDFVRGFTFCNGRFFMRVDKTKIYFLKFVSWDKEEI